MIAQSRQNAKTSENIDVEKCEKARKHAVFCVFTGFGKWGGMRGTIPQQVPYLQGFFLALVCLWCFFLHFMGRFMYDAAASGTARKSASYRNRNNIT